MILVHEILRKFLHQHVIDLPISPTGYML